MGLVCVVYLCGRLCVDQGSKYQPVRPVPAGSYRKMGGPSRILTGIPARLDFTSVSADSRHVSARIRYIQRYSPIHTLIVAGMDENQHRKPARSKLLWAVEFTLIFKLLQRRFPGKAAGVRIAGQGAPIETAPAKKKRCRNPPHFAIINILFHDNKDITPKGCEREVSEAANGVSDELKSERIIGLSWALVHSKQPEDIQHGIAMLEDPCQKLNNSSLAASLANSGSPLQKREKLYLLAVGYYRSGEYRRSRQLAEQCLEIAPDWMQALTLKKTLDDQITKDGLIGIGITATVVGLVAGGIAASLG
ncbi:unnamed protein product [Camellia sinensis]